MDRGRFSLLQLDPGEIYFEDYSAIFIPPDTTPKTYDVKKQDGRLKMCSKSLVFDPKDINKPMIKIQLKDCVIIEQWKGSAKFLQSNNVLSVNCREYIEMLERNIIAPYQFKDSANFLFLLNYANIMNCLPQICQLHRASTLPAAEQADMIATIVHSRQARVSFNPLWLDLYEKIVMETQADKVTPLVVNPGRILLSTSRLCFQPYNNIEQYPVLKIDLNSIKRIVKRRFLLQQIGLEIYSNENSSNPHIYLSFKNQKLRDEFYDNLLQQPELKLNEIEQDVMTLQWQNGIISNYEYLLYINSLGDRTINDLTQYPVFPWIISNYSGEKLDLNDPENFRDLSKPIGALNELRLGRLLERYNEMSHPKFMYGSHYSTPGFVLYYLARQYPHYVLCLQSGRFDHPDRMFNSVADAFKNCQTNMSDFKELIPEFYDISQEGKFLVNNMGINFGYRHNNVKVGDVELPHWTNGPKHFIEKLRDALESDVASKNLHKWIDLIFGYKQKGEEAVKANNLFYHLCYEGNVDLDSIIDLNERHALEVQIMEFGQIPKQVFKVPHPQRKVGLKLLTEPYQITQDDPKLEDKWKTMTNLCLQTSFNSHKNTVSHIFISDDGTRITSVGYDSKLKVFSLPQNKQTRSANIGNMPLSSCIQLPNINVLVIGSWDNQILLYDLDYGKVKESVLAHEDAITCMSFASKINLLVSGSGDCTVKIWKGLNSDGIIKPIQCLHKQIDHNSQVTCLCFDRENKYLAVGTEDGEIYVWETTNFTLFKKYDKHCSSIRALSYSPEGLKLAIGSSDKLFQIIDVNTGMPVFSKTLKSSISSLKWNEFLLVLGCDDGGLSIWDIFEVKLLLEVKAHSDVIKTLDISLEREFIATGSQDRVIKVWKPKTNNL
ncbi:protein FAN-like [Anoplophora glabripennis]|uniref:protein FAN-like n=1 Tax=Anoplophora glabripennis TaxID=217634 RepID=UPI000873C4D6|nr:protein FAN-like [Anoplophora glabripennis]